MARGGVSEEGGRELSKRGARVGWWIGGIRERREEAAAGASTFDDCGLSDPRGEPEVAPHGARQAELGAGEAQGGGQRQERREAVGALEEGGGGAERQHGGMMPTGHGGSLIKTVRAVPSPLSCFGAAQRLFLQFPSCLVLDLLMRTCWLNGTFLPEDQAHLSIFDRGVLFGDGVYEVAAVVNGRLLDADRHLVRLARSQGEIGLPAPYSAAEWLEVMQTLATTNGIEEGLVYLQVTRGPAERDFTFPGTVTPTAFAFARPKRLLDDPNAVGVRVHVVPDLRWQRCDIKSTAMLAQVLAKQAARQAGAFEAMMHEDGLVTEGGSSNLWIVTDGTVYTRPLFHDILAGITRDIVLEVAAEAGIPVRQRAFTVAQAHAADECFMTSATSFVLPIVHIDAHQVGTGHMGAITAQLRAGYIARVQQLTR